MEKKQNRAVSILMNLDIAIASVILAVLIVLTFAGVIWRYIFSNPFTWLEEVQTSCMVWIVFAAAGAAFIKEAIPFYILLAVNLLLLTWFEPFTTFLVNLFY